MDTADMLVELAKHPNINKLCFCKIDFSKDEECPGDEVSMLIFHRKNTNYIYAETNRVKKTTVIDLSRDNYVFNSQVLLTDGTIAHFPLMDFNICVSEDGLTKVNKILTLLGVKQGYLMDSGSSYHFIGSEPMPVDEYHAFLYKSLLFAPITDGRWIAHQLINGNSNLRIGEKNGVSPQLICKIG